MVYLGNPRIKIGRRDIETVRLKFKDIEAIIRNQIDFHSWGEIFRRIKE